MDRFRSLIRSLDRRLDLQSQDGFGIIEVLVSAVIVVLLSLGVFAAIDAAGRTADTNKGRSAASTLATQDQERLRSLPITQVADKDEDNYFMVDNKRYKVRSQGAYDVGQAGSSNCASSDEEPRHVKLTSTVTWDGIKVKSIKQDSLRAIPNRSLEGLGSLAVDIDRAAGSGLAGVTVNITGPKTASGVTNAQGCVIFGFIPTGNYTISFGQVNYITPENTTPPTTNVTGQAVVAENAIASKSFVYDQAGAAAVNYQATTFGSSTAGIAATNGNGFTIANAGWGVNNTKNFTHGSAATYTSPAVNFPFTGAYEAWSGRCAENRNAAYLGSLTISPGGTGTANVREFRMRFRVQRRTTNSTTATNNYGTVPNDAKATVKLTPNTAGCTDTQLRTDMTATPTGSTGTATANYTTWEATVPWGTYDLCVAYDNGASQRARNNSVVDVVTTAAGYQYPTRILIPFNQAAPNTC